ncbi:MAG: hypothetical protein ACLTBV_03575 [Enterocloster bolteae]
MNINISRTSGEMAQRAAACAAQAINRTTIAQNRGGQNSPVHRRVPDRGNQVSD